MDLFLIIAFVMALYWRTRNYCYLIDDIVRRWGFLLEIPEHSPPPEFYSKKAPKTKHIFLALTHSMNVSVIYFLWGWKAALLFAVNPVCVACTAWITGGYYQVTTFFTLVAYYFIAAFKGIAGMLLGALFFTAALGSTINCIAIPFIFFVHPPVTGLILLWPLAFYVFGRRFRIGFRKRNIGKADPITWRKLAVVPKVLAHYIQTTLFPKNLAFFKEFGYEYGKDPKVKEDLESFNEHFWTSVMTVFAFCAAGFALSPIGTLIYLAGILPFTQWKVLGQFVAERYMYLPMVGWSVILANVFVHPWTMPIFGAIVGLYVVRAHKYIPAFENIETLYENGIEQFPKCISNYVNLAERKLHKGQLYEAYKLLSRGLEIDPKSFLCHANMAAYWLAINQPERGKYHTEMAMRFSEHRGMAYSVFRNQMQHIENGMAMVSQAKAEAEKHLARIKAEEAQACLTP